MYLETANRAGMRFKTKRAHHQALDDATSDGRNSQRLLINNVLLKPPNLPDPQTLDTEQRLEPQDTPPDHPQRTPPKPQDTQPTTHHTEPINKTQTIRQLL